MRIEEKPVPKRKTIEPTPQTPPEKGSGPVTLNMQAGSLPDDYNELLGILGDPANLAQALGAMDKLGEQIGRNMHADLEEYPRVDFSPLVQRMVPMGSSGDIREFASSLMPMRRALAKEYGGESVELAMILDLLVLAYWRVVQTEGLIVRLMHQAIKFPEYFKHIEGLERIKENANRQYLRMLDSLRRLTGRSAGLSPEDGYRLLRFPVVKQAEAVGKRKTAGSRR